MGRHREPPVFNQHHRKAKCRGGGNNPDNLSTVKVKKHCAFHTLFEDTHPKKIEQELNELWIDPEWVVIAVPKVHERLIRRVIPD